MEKFTLENCKLRDLRRIFVGVKSSSKILVNGMNDVTIKFRDDGVIEFITDGNKSQNKKEMAPIEEKSVASPLRNTSQDPLSGIDKLTEMYIDALNGRKALILEKSERNAMERASQNYFPDNQYPSFISPGKHVSSYEDIMQFIKRHGFTIPMVAHILVNKKKWRKALTKALKRRKKSGKFKKSTKGMSTPIDLSKLFAKSPELPSKKSICFIKVPYRGYFVPEDFSKSKIINYDDRQNFMNACKRYYEESGCEVFNTTMNDDYVTITMIKKENKTPSKSILEYMK